MDELQALNELYSSPESPPESVIQRQREKLITTIEATRTADPQLPGRSHRRRVIALVGIPVAAVALAAAGWVVLHDEPREVVAFGCVADGVSAVLPNDGTPPLEACLAEWESGNMLEGVTTAPPLAACISSSALIEVIVAESPDACEEAGMGEWTGQADYETVGAAVRAVRVSFHDRYDATGNGCATEQDWRTGLGRQPGAEAWTIDADRVESDRRCFDLGSIDPGTLTVTLIGVPGDYSIGCDPRTGC